MTGAPAQQLLAGFPPVRAEARPELLARGSPAMRIVAEPVFALYSLPGFILPLMHPATAAATLGHDRVFTDPDTHVFDFARRLRDTIEMIAGVAHAGPEAAHVTHAMRELHRPMAGQDTRGEQYHAWTRDIWTWNWAAIVAGYLRGYEQLRGWPSAEFREDAYLGMVEIGRRFGVLGMPATYDDFLIEWPVHRDRVADPGNAGVQRLLGLTRTRGMPAPRWLRWMPLPLWALVTMPVRHALRVSITAGMSAEERTMIGFDERRRDRIAARVHTTFWRSALPRSLSYRIGLAWMAARARWGEPVWRTRFSAETLAARKA